MSTIIFKTPNATFHFWLSDVMVHLEYGVSQNIPEATKLLKEISTSPSKVKQVTADYFGYIALKLLKEDKGAIFCNSCQKIYLPNELQSKQVGFGKNPFSIEFKPEKGTLERTFNIKKPIPGMRGGERYECPEGHELISMTTWIS